MIPTSLLFKFVLVYFWLKRKRYVLLAINMILTAILLLYAPVYYKQGVTVLDSWKYEFLWNSYGGTILWRDVAAEVILTDIICTLMVAGMFVVRKTGLS